MMSSSDHLGVAVSGGADSVVLLHILHSFLKNTGQKLTVLHVNHRLRGIESDADQEFVSSLTHSLGLPLLTRSSPVAAGNLEQEARSSRLAFFQLCRQQHGITRIALGHTQTDQAETVLFRLLRGAGLTGLAGMLPVTRLGLIRPLLFSSREEVRKFAEQEHLSWREDASNNDLRFRRNRIRLVTMPQLRQDHNPGLDKVLSRVAENAQSEENYWDRHISRLFQRLVKQQPIGLTISCMALRKLHLAQQRRLLRRSLSLVRRDLRSVDSSHIEGILLICASEHGHDRHMLPGVDAIRSFDTLLLTSPGTMKQARSYELDVPLSVPVQLPFSAGLLIVDRFQSEEENCVTVKDKAVILEEAAYLDAEVVRKLSPGESFKVRNWEPGDRFQEPGSSRSEKIKTLFQKTRVVLWERKHWPVLAVGEKIAWARGFGTDGGFCPGSNAKSLFRVRFKQVY